MPGSSAHQAALAAARITAGSRASEYLGLTASQLTQKKLGRAGANGAIASLSASTARSMSPSVSPNKPGSRSPNTKVANRQSTSSTTSNGGNSGIASPQFGLRQPGPMAQSSSREKIGLSRRVSTSSNGSGISSPTPRGPAGELAYGGSNQRRLSSSTNSRPQTPSILPSPSTSEYKVMSAEALVAAASSAVDEEESFQAKLNRLAADNSAEGTDEATMRMHQMQLRVEVLEAENRFLKLENAQNKNAEKLFERNLLLRRGTGEENDGSLAAVEEVERLRKQFDESKERWQVERDALSDKVNALAREKEAAEGKARMAEEKVAIVEANAAAAVAMDRDRSGPDTRQMEEEMESVHEKVLNLTEVVRVKDRFLEDLTKQVMELRNEMEKKEREIRLAKADFEKEKKESAGLAVGGASTEELEKVRAELETTKKTAEKEKAEKMSELEKVIKEREAAEAAHKAKVAELDATVDDLKKDCMESLELHETTVEVHKANMEALRATLDDEKRKVKMLESECDELRKATVEAFGVCEVTIDELKKEMESQIEDKDAAIKRVRAEADGLKKEIEEMVKASQAGKDEEVEKIRAVWESEKKRLEERIEMGQKEVDKVKEERERIKAESERLKEEVKELDKLKNERTKLEERLKDTEKDYEEHLNARRRLTEDIKVANEEKQKAEGENRRMVEAKEKMERERERMDKELRDLKEKTEAAQAQASKEINEYKEKLEAAEQQAAKLQDQLQGPAAKAAEKTRTDLEAQIVTLKSQHFAQLEMLQDEIERLDAHSKMLVKQKEELALKLESNSRKSVDMVRSTSTSSSKAGRREKELESQIATYEEQVAGLKHLCDNIAKENEAIHAENKRLMGEYENLSEAHKQVESECLKLMDEVERLHAEGLLGLGAVPPVDAAAPGSEEAKEGEDETSAATAAAAAAGSSSVLPASVAGEVAKLQVQLAEKQAQLDKLGMQHASELREVRQRYSELERTKQREIHALTKDVAELESLVESKIFKEADLEEMLESERKQIRRLREDVQELKQQVKELSDGAVFGSVASRQKSGSRSAADIKGSSSSNGSSRRHSDINEEDEDEDEDEDKPYCELCEESGHDIISCTAVLNGAGGRANGIARNTATTIKVARDEDERPVSASPVISSTMSPVLKWITSAVLGESVSKSYLFITPFAMILIRLLSPIVLRQLRGVRTSLDRSLSESGRNILGSDWELRWIFSYLGTINPSFST